MRSRASQPARERPCYPEPRKLPLLPLGLVNAQCGLGYLLFPFTSAGRNQGS